MLHCVGVCGIVEVSPDNMTERRGMNATLLCVADSEESRIWGVVWEFMKHDWKLATTLCFGTARRTPSSQKHEKYQCKSEANKHSLIIQDLSFNDSGKYVCIEDGGRGPGKDYLQLFVSEGQHASRSSLSLRSY